MLWSMAAALLLRRRTAHVAGEERQPGRRSAQQEGSVAAVCCGRRCTDLRRQPELRPATWHLCGPKDLPAQAAQLLGQPLRRRRQAGERGAWA